MRGVHGAKGFDRSQPAEALTENAKQREERKPEIGADEDGNELIGFHGFDPCHGRISAIRRTRHAVYFALKISKTSPFHNLSGFS
jgi:hypothetical protein